MTKSVDEPLPGIVARPNLSLVIPHRKGNVKTTDEPLHTVATRIGRPGRGRRDRCRRLPVSSAQTARTWPGPTLFGQLPGDRQRLRADDGLRQRRQLQRCAMARRHRRRSARRRSMSGQTEQWEQWVGSHSRPVQRTKRHVKSRPATGAPGSPTPTNRWHQGHRRDAEQRPTKSCDQGHHDDCPHRLGGPKKAAA